MVLMQLYFIAIVIAIFETPVTSVPVPTRSATATTISSRIVNFVVLSCSSGDIADLPPYTSVMANPDYTARQGSSLVELNALQSYMRNLSHMTSGVIANYSSWLDTKSYTIQQGLMNYVSSKYVIQRTSHADLSSEMNGYLYKITQLAIFADVLWIVKDDPSFGESRLTIRKILAELRNAVCCLKQLVWPNISNNDLVKFVTQDVAQVPGFPFQTSDTRRAVIMTLLKRMSPFINS